jgi:hypothetical protein
MTTNSDLPSTAANHVSSMLTLAKQKHEEAMAMIGIPDANAIARLRQVLQLLEEVELLAEDAGSYVENDAMLVALKELQQQQASIKLAIERLEKLSKHSPWVSPWPWIVAMALWCFCKTYADVAYAAHHVIDMHQGWAGGATGGRLQRLWARRSRSQPVR